MTSTSPSKSKFSWSAPASSKVVIDGWYFRSLSLGSVYLLNNTAIFGFRIVKMNVDFLHGRREGSYIYHCNDGFYYHFNNGYNYANNENSSVVHLRCVNYSSRQCQGTAKVITSDEGPQWTNLQPHTCAPDGSHHQVLRLRQQILQESANLQGPYETPSEIVNRVRDQ